jgi:biopolymer transport protein ExbD
MPVTLPSPNAKRRARIEIIPLIDIIFFLLATFVMVSLSMVKNKGIPVNLPAASTAQPQDRKDFASISITEKGEVYFDKVLVTPVELEESLKTLLAQNPEPKVFINGDTKAEYGKAVEVLDTARRLGIVKIAIETRAKAASVTTAAPLPSAGVPAASAAPAPAPSTTPPIPAPNPDTPPTQ